MAGIAKCLRSVGMAGVYFGAAFTLLSWTLLPLTGLFLFLTGRVGNLPDVAVLSFVVVSGIGIAGLFTFEFSRLLAFERHERELKEA